MHPAQTAPHLLARIDLTVAVFEIVHTPEGSRCRSNLLDEEDGLRFGNDDLYEAAVLALEEVVLAHHEGGVDIRANGYSQGIRRAVGRLIRRYD